MLRDRDWVVPAVIAVVIVIVTIVAIQQFRFSCFDIGFVKSCAVSTVR